MNLDFLHNDENSKDVYKSIVTHTKEYINLQIKLLKLNSIETLSKILALLLVILAGSVLLMAAFVCFSMIFVVWMKNVTGNIMYGFLIIGAFFVVLFFLLFLLRNKLFMNPIIRKLSAILFNVKEEEVDHDE